MEDEYNVVIDTLQKKLESLEEMQRGCDNISMSLGGGCSIMDCIRYEKMEDLREAINREKTKGADTPSQAQVQQLLEALKRFVYEGCELEPQKRYLWQEARAAIAAFEGTKK